MVSALENHKKNLLDRLLAAGPAGLSKTALGIRTGTLRDKAINELINIGAVINRGAPGRSCYVLAEFNQSRPIAAEDLDRRLCSGPPVLLTRTELTRGPGGPAGREADRAIDWLIDQGRLLKLTRGRQTYYLHTGTIKSPAAASEKQDDRPAAFQPPGRDEILAAYQRLTTRYGFSNVRIYDLKQESGANLNDLKKFIQEEHQLGRAVLSAGDWSLSSNPIRSAAVYWQDEPFLLVRFKD